MNCSDTQKIVNNMMSLYTDCASVQTANLYLAQTTLDLNGILINILKLYKSKSEGSEDDVDEVDITAFSNTQWCIL